MEYFKWKSIVFTFWPKRSHELSIDFAASLSFLDPAGYDLPFMSKRLRILSNGRVSEWSNKEYELNSQPHFTNVKIAVSVLLYCLQSGEAIQHFKNCKSDTHTG